MNTKQNISVIVCLVFSFQVHAFDFNKALGDFTKSVEDFGESIKIKIPNNGEASKSQSASSNTAVTGQQQTKYTAVDASMKDIVPIPSSKVKYTNADANIFYNDEKENGLAIDKKLLNSAYTVIDWSDNPNSFQVRDIKLGESFASVRSRYKDYRLMPIRQQTIGSGNGDGFTITNKVDKNRGVLDKFQVAFAGDDSDNLGPVRYIQIIQNLGPLDLNEPKSCEIRTNSVLKKLAAKYGVSQDKTIGHWDRGKSGVHNRGRASNLSASFECRNDLILTLVAKGEYVDWQLELIKRKKIVIERTKARENYMKNTSEVEATF